MSVLKHLSQWLTDPRIKVTSSCGAIQNNRVQDANFFLSFALLLSTIDPNETFQSGTYLKAIAIGIILLLDGRSNAFESKELNKDVDHYYATYEQELFHVVHTLKVYCHYSCDVLEITFDYETLKWFVNKSNKLEMLKGSLTGNPLWLRL